MTECRESTAHITSSDGETGHAGGASGEPLLRAESAPKRCMSELITHQHQLIVLQSEKAIDCLR